MSSVARIAMVCMVRVALSMISILCFFSLSLPFKMVPRAQVTVIYSTLCGRRGSSGTSTGSGTGSPEDPVVVSMWGALAATGGLTVMLPFVWHVPEPEELRLILLLALITALSQTLMITAMSMAQADRIAPFTYFEIIAAILIGFAMFGTLPDVLALIGMGLIITSGTAVKRIPDILKALGGKKS